MTRAFTFLSAVCLFAYSSTTGTWDVLRVSGVERFQPVVVDDVVFVRVRREIYTFAAASGKWTSPSFENNSNATVAPGETGKERRAASSDALKLMEEAYEAAERRALKTAKRIRETEMKSASDPKARALLRRELMQRVEEAFQAQQELQQGRLIVLGERLELLRSRLALRKAAREAMVNRRVEELLDTGTRLDIARPTTASPDPSSPSHRDSSRYLKLLEQRLETAKALYETGKITIADVNRAARAYWRARIEESTSEAGRKAAWDQYIGLLKFHVKQAETLYRNGKISHFEILGLQAELERTQERRKAGRLPGD